MLAILLKFLTLVCIRYFIMYGQVILWNVALFLFNLLTKKLMLWGVVMGYIPKMKISFRVSMLWRLYKVILHLHCPRKV